MPKDRSTTEGNPSATVTTGEAETAASSSPVIENAAETPHLSVTEQATDIVRRNTYWAAGLGAIPIPGVDLAGIMGSQVKMLNDLSKLYGVKFCENKAKNIIGVLLGSIGAVNLTLLPVSSLLKLVPGIGTILGGFSLPIIAGAASYALGKVFIQHYESGGTMLDLYPEKTKEYFRKHFEEGKTVAAAK